MSAGEEGLSALQLVGIATGRYGHQKEARQCDRYTCWLGTAFRGQSAKVKVKHSSNKYVSLFTDSGTAAGNCDSVDRRTD
jgi:hypothetical protein